MKQCPVQHPLRPGLPPLPKRIAALPRDKRGYPVPWFVQWIHGEPEFRIADRRKVPLCINERRCWTCGEPIGRELTFVLGPMCSINRISAEPASHAECALFAVQACPFLSRPEMVRRENGLPPQAALDNGPGVAIARNPGAIALWATRDYTLVRDQGGVLFRVGEPLRVRWFAEGRAATRAEVEHSIETGLPILQEMAESQGVEAVMALKSMYHAALRYLPADTAPCAAL